MKKPIAILALLLLTVCMAPLLLPAGLMAAGGLQADLSDAGTYFVEDEASLLTDSQRRALESRAEAISERYRSEVRILTVYDMGTYGYRDIEAFSYDLYRSLDFGYGPDKDCILFVLSTGDRDYDLRAWGEHSKEAYTFYAIDTLLDRHVLPLLKEDNYYGAFSAYLDQTEEYFRLAEKGTPFSRSNDPVLRRNMLYGKLAVTILVPLLCALIVCTVWRSRMKTAKIAKTAFNYIPANGFRLTGQGDVYLFRTVTRTRIQSSSSSSGGGASSGRGRSSARSGKY